MYTTANLNRAQYLMSIGHIDRAVDSQRMVLSEDPNSLEGHALLANCLVQQKRLNAARFEAEQALTLDPEHPTAHYASYHVALASRQFKKAQEHLDFLLAMVEADHGLFLMQAQLAGIQGDKRAQKEALDKAREYGPDEVDVLTALGDFALASGDLAEAYRCAHAALSKMPEDQDALVLMGFVHLRKGDREAAYEKMQWALRINPTDPGALRLLASVKASQSKLLGLWWRYNVKMSEMGEAGSVIILLGAFFIYSAVKIYLDQIGATQYAGPLTWFWLGLCLYTWVAPTMFHNMLKKELDNVKLSDDF